VWARVPVVLQKQPEATSIEAVIVLALFSFAPVYCKSLLVIRQIVCIRVKHAVPSHSHLGQEAVFVNVSGRGAADA